jgi:hypothetical protein
MELVVLWQGFAKHQGRRRNFSRASLSTMWWRRITRERRSSAMACRGAAALSLHLYI